MITVPVHQYLFNIQENGDVYRMIRKGEEYLYKLEPENKLSGKALVKYGVHNELPTRVFNGHRYIKVLGKVLSLSSYKHIHDQNIIGLFT